MSTDEKEPAFTRSDGVTESERYLNKLADQSFLSMWSYPGLFVKKTTQGLVRGRELCDLFVLFENTILIFSDKTGEFGPTTDLELSWSRWFRTVAKAARQAQGAKRRLLRSARELFLDRECTKSFPLGVDLVDARLHLIVVAHGAANACANVLGGSGSLMIRTDLKGYNAHTVPFTIGDLDPNDTFIHVFDDTTLDVVMQERNTITDFAHYLRKKEAFLRSNRPIAIEGEEDLLAIYLQTVNDSDEHDLIILPEATGGLTVVGSFWNDFAESPQRKCQLEHDAISYSWDALIEKFNYHAISGDQLSFSENVAEPGNAVIETERVKRFMARESRMRRRMLARALSELLGKTAANNRGISVICPSRAGDPHYAFLAFPAWSGTWTGVMTEEYLHYRELRGYVLHSLLLSVKLEFPDAEDIVGIATESGFDAYPRSEDCGYIDTRDWCEYLEHEAIARRRELHLLENVNMRQQTVQEFPSVTLRGELVFPPGKNPRNKPCPCGSGVKFKRCHGA
jgi:hypothetical protein